MKAFGFLFSLFLICLSYAYGQDGNNSPIKNPSFIGFNIEYGHILKHTHSLRDFDNAFPTGLSLDWSRFLLQKEAWDFCNCFPKLGAEISYYDFDNEEILGQGALAMGYIEPYFRTDKTMNLFFRIGLGGAYLSKPFNETTNPLNDLYSTDLSFALMLGIGTTYRIDELWNLRLLAKYNHTSNGGVNTPNRGLNFPTLSLGLTRSFSPFKFPEYEKVGKREPPKDKTRVSLTHFSGWSNTSIGGKDKFYVFGFQGKYSRWIGGRSALTGGTEFIFDFSKRKLIQERGDGENFVQAAALIGHEFWLGKVTFGQQIGYYYWNEYINSDRFYQRYSLTYNFSPKFFGGFGLKAHRHIADFFDLRLGYRFL
jgi:hypothetical protein